MKLQQKLDGNKKESGEQHGPHFATRQPHAPDRDHRRHSQARKQETVEHHVIDVHLIERDPAPVESGAPQRCRRSARAVAEELVASAVWRSCQCGPARSPLIYFYCRTSGAGLFPCSCTPGSLATTS